MPSKIYPYLLTLIVFIISFQNYTPGTTLMGFDSWHPEFNFSAAFEKTLSVWQEYMGLGTHGPMSFASDLSRNIFLLLFSFFLPESFLRYLWTFAMLLVGALGMYFFLNVSVFGRGRNYSRDLAFLGTLFYIFNLSTLQLFYTSFDGFIAQFAFLPWLFWSGKSLLDGYSKKNVLIFLLITFVSTSQAYTGTLFFAFLIYYFFYLLYEVLIYPEKKKRFFNLVRIFVFYFLANFFWLGPVIYAIALGAENVSKTTINLLSSEESFFLNQKYGDLGNILELRNFWFDSTDFNNRFGTFDPLLDDWAKHLALNSSVTIHYIFVFLIVLGLIISVFVKKFRIFSFLFVISIFFLTAGREPFSLPYNFLRDNIPLLKEALRFPFTKFSILASFTYAILFSVGISFILDKVSAFLSNYKNSDRVVFLICILFLTLFVNRFFPYFEGKLLNPNTKVFLPGEYSRLFEYFNSRSTEERVFLAPADKFWAWTYYDFGYRGSGFVMYGLKQPVIYRSYDVWNKTNESIYWEVNYAVESNDEKLLASIINKYQIKHFIIDRNVIIPGLSLEENLKLSNNFQILLEKTNLISTKKSFGKILVLETKIEIGMAGLNQFLSPVSSYQGLRYKDPVHQVIGDYLEVPQKESSVSKEIINYPYSFLSSLRNLNKDRYQLLDGGKKIRLLPLTKSEISSNKESTNLYQVTFDKNSLNLLATGLASESVSFSLPNYTNLVYIDDKNYFDIKNFESKNFLVSEASTLNFYSESNSKTYLINEFYEGKIELDSCKENPTGSFSYQFINGSLVISASENNPTLCLFSKINKNIFSKGNPVSIQLNLFSSKDSYLTFCLQDNENKKCQIEGFLNKDNNFTFAFNPIKNSNDYTLFLFPDLSRKEGGSFEIGNLIVTNYNFIRQVDFKDLPKQLSDQNQQMKFNLTEINLTNKSFLNLCSSVKGESEYVKFESSEISFSSNKSLCLNLLEGEGYFKQNQTGYLAVLNYSLINEKGVPICAGGKSECLTIDKLQPGRNLERVLILPKSSLNLRVDLSSIVGSRSSFKVNSLQITEIDLEGNSVLNSQVKEKDKSEISTKSVKLDGARISPWLYIVDKKDITENQRFLTLNQDNQKGWVAFCDFSPCVFAGSSNGYALTWEISSAKERVTIIYVPQFLLFFGFIILMVLFLSRFHKRTNP